MIKEAKSVRIELRPMHSIMHAYLYQDEELISVNQNLQTLLGSYVRLMGGWSGVTPSNRYWQYYSATRDGRSIGFRDYDFKDDCSTERVVDIFKELNSIFPSEVLPLVI